MAAGLGFKEFTTGDVLTAADANGYLASQVVMVFASSAARASAITSPQEGMITYLKDTNSTEYYSGSAYVAIGGGGGGKLLQVVSAATTTQVTVASTSYTDSGLTATITPTLNTSKILVLTSQVVAISRSANQTNNGVRLLRGATSIGEFGDASALYSNSFIIGGSTSIEQRSILSINYMDAPATTSATTYKIQGACNTTANSSNFIFQHQSLIGNIILMEIGA
jgi:hypothetical protein